jgi:hypothetical protein
MYLMFIKDNFGMTALMYASMNGHDQVVKLLIEKGANMNLQDGKFGNMKTALMYACQYGHVEVISILLRNGADVAIKSNENKTALDYAINDEIRNFIQTMDYSCLNAMLLNQISKLRKEIEERDKQIIEQKQHIDILEKRLAFRLDIVNVLAKSLSENNNLYQDNSFIYHKEHILDFHNQIHKYPFFDGGPSNEWENLDQLMALPINDREVILVDAEKDEQLVKMSNDLEKNLGTGSAADCFKQIALYVHKNMNGNNLNDWASHIEELKKKGNSNVLNIGDIKIGISRHRAILFKFLCDKLTTSDRPLLCRLVRDCGKKANAWNVVFNPTDGFYYVVDIMKEPGRLLREGTIDCENYKKERYSIFFNLMKNSNENDNEQFRKGELLGSGSFGKVYTAIYGSDNSYAMKILKMESVNDAMNEINLMAFINHENLMKLERSYIYSNKLILIMKRMECNGHVLIHKMNILHNPIQLTSFLLQVARGIRYLHRHNIIHRDLKPQNILLNLKKIGSTTVIDQVKVTDFGASKLLTNSQFTDSIAGTTVYAAPELFLGKYDNKIDTFSFGVTLGEAATKILTVSRNKLARKQFKEANREMLYELYSKCVEDNPLARFDFELIVKNLEILLASLMLKEQEEKT